ncbi:hypothetical protein SEA_SCHMIDT_2 [Gordonia phage Schmidt]|uniref:Uncharacterized protein n=1 Tax=Gordonia phage Schmidt TaxID=2301697 RepID=A0A385E0C8_9CAUD|nr:hypothetical protein KDJ59_gp02 [Gordonia phage Schmidt]AXQ65124.1 hypothetical protein SEA_SCHMIDT_2 [Gordonia phage Schmidt]
MTLIPYGYNVMDMTNTADTATIHHYADGFTIREVTIRDRDRTFTNAYVRFTENGCDFQTGAYGSLEDAEYRMRCERRRIFGSLAENVMCNCGHCDACGHPATCDGH